jgi:hypothetical protein
MQADCKELQSEADHFRKSAANMLSERDNAQRMLSMHGANQYGHSNENFARRSAKARNNKGNNGGNHAYDDDRRDSNRRDEDRGNKGTKGRGGGKGGSKGGDKKIRY